jgi:hypothetical protein
MHALKVSTLALTGLLLATALAPAAGDAGQARPALRIQNTPDNVSAPGDGAFCALAIYGVIAEVGRTCFTGENPVAQAEFERGVTRLKAYVLANDKSFTEAGIEQFMRDKASVGAPKDQLCASQVVGLYQSLVPKTVAVRAQIDGVVARPGAPTWGGCLDD